MVMLGMLVVLGVVMGTLVNEGWRNMVVLEVVM